jgi:GMP synthase (glutamine-hydrolysing)
MMGDPSVVVLEHAPAETAGIIAEELEARGMSLRVVRTFAGDAVPSELSPARGLVVMGGPMSVYEADRYPFLAEEMRLIENAVRSDLPVLGVCLGSQLVAATLGAQVTRGNRKEIGWHTASLAEGALIDPLWVGMPHSFQAFHWHGDVFTLPSGAVRLASSELTEHQAFRYGRATYGVLCHLEVTPPIVHAMVHAFGSELAEEGLSGDAILQRAEELLPGSMELGRHVYGGWAGLVAATEVSGA